MSFTCLVFSIWCCLAWCRTAPCCLRKVVLQWSLHCTGLSTASFSGGTNAVPIDGSLEIGCSCCSHGGSGWSPKNWGQVQICSLSSCWTLLCARCLGELFELLPWVRDAELNLCYALGITWAFFFICVCTVWDDYWILVSVNSVEPVINQEQLSRGWYLVQGRFCSWSAGEFSVSPLRCTTYCQVEPSVENQWIWLFKLGIQTVGEIFFETN